MPDARRIFPRSDRKRPTGRLLAGHYEEQPIIGLPQPQCRRCHRAGSGQATLEVIDSKQSYAANWCKLNNDDDDDKTTLLCTIWEI